jgi:DegV family protein with EDD domain
MSKVAVVTDSTAYIPSGLIRGLCIQSLPLQVIWGDHIFLDGVDIHPDEFYTRLATAKTMPTTSQVTPVLFRDLYARLLDEGYDIFSIHISAKLSGTQDSAVQAREYFPGSKIEIFDSESTSMAMGFQALSVARAASQGATLKECAAIAEKARANTDVYFVVSTLEFLRRGGRIGGAAAFLGTALNLKPILKLQEGKIEAVEKIRTMSKALDRLEEIMEKRLAGKQTISLAAIHAKAPQEAQALLDRLKNKFGVTNITDAVLTEVSPVIGSHTGPGTVGIAFMAGL